MKFTLMIFALIVSVATSVNAATVRIDGPSHLIAGEKQAYTFTWDSMVPDNWSQDSQGAGLAVITYGDKYFAFRPNLTGESRTFDLTFDKVGVNKISFYSAAVFYRKVKEFSGFTGCHHKSHYCVGRPEYDLKTEFKKDFSYQYSLVHVSAPVPAPAPVPLPASALLMFGGLAGLGALRLRRRA